MCVHRDLLLSTFPLISDLSLDFVLFGFRHEAKYSLASIKNESVCVLAADPISGKYLSKKVLKICQNTAKILRKQVKYVKAPWCTKGPSCKTCFKVSCWKFKLKTFIVFKMNLLLLCLTTLGHGFLH